MWKNILFAPDGDPGGSGGEGEGGGDSAEPPEGNEPEAQDLVPREELSRVNREAAKYRRERNDLQNRLKAFEDAEKTEIERLQGQVDTLTKKLGETSTRERELRVQVLAERVGISPDARSDASKLLDWGSVEDPDDDSVLEAHLKALVKERPYLRGGAHLGADGGAGGDGRTTSAGMNDQIRRAAGRR